MAAIAISLRALHRLLESHSSDARCQSAVKHRTERLLWLQTSLQECRTKDATAGQLHTAAQTPLTIQATRSCPGGIPRHRRAGSSIAILLPRSRSPKAAGKEEPEGAGRGPPRGSRERRATRLRKVKNLSFLSTGGQREKGNLLTVFTKKFPRAFFLLMFLSLPFGSLEVVRALVSLTVLQSVGSLTELVLSLDRNFQTGKGFLTSY